MTSHFFAQQMGRSHAPRPCRPHHGHPPQNQRIPFLCVTDHSSGHTEEWESVTLTRGATPKRGKTLPGTLTHSLRPRLVKRVPPLWSYLREATHCLVALSYHVGLLSLLPRGRKARRSLSGRGGGAPRPPVTLSCKADPGDYPAGLALP